MITGSFAEVLDLAVTLEGAAGPYAMAYLKDRRRGTLQAWNMGTSVGQLRSMELHAPSVRLPLYAGLQGTVVLAAVGAGGSFTGRLRAVIDHDGTESAWAGGRA